MALAKFCLLIALALFLFLCYVLHFHNKCERLIEMEEGSTCEISEIAGEGG